MILEQANVSGYFADFADWISLIVIPVMMAAEAHIAINAVLDAVEEHFAADDGCRATEGTHCHLPTTTLQKSAQAALLASRDIGRSGYDACQASVAPGTVWCSHL
jgi:hypothetical protein